MVERVALRLEDVQAAARRIEAGVIRTPCRESRALSELTGCRIFCKFENFQHTGSFKERGARNALLLLDEAARRRGVVAASAGNHAQALAFHGTDLGVAVTVVMPRFAPRTKIEACRAFGARVLLVGESFRDARAEAHRLVELEGLTYIDGYDSPEIIAGQGTVGLEILEQVPEVEAIVVPVGGGGLLAGIALAVASLRPEVEIYAAEPRRLASWTAALEAGRPVSLPPQPTLADGLAVPEVGARAFHLAKDRHRGCVVVSERAIAQAILRLVEVEKTLVEGAGATGLAALLAGRLDHLRGKTVVLPLSGGNIDTSMLGRIIDRGLVADGRLCRFEAVISDRPGGLNHFTAVLADEEVSIADIAHDRAFAGEDVTTVIVRCVVETRDWEHIRRLRDRLSDEGYRATFQ